MISSEEEIIDIEESEISSVTEEDFNEYMDPMSVFGSADITDRTAFLWQYKPVPDDEPEPFDEYRFSEKDFENGKIIAATVRGKKHKHEGTNCDDWFEFDSSGEWRIMAVSDGAGSKKFSRIGARESCKSAVEFLKGKLAESPDEMKDKLSLPVSDKGFMEGCGYFASLLQDSVQTASKSVSDAFEERKSKFEYLRLVDRNLELKDFSGTFLICIMIPVSTAEGKEYFAAAIQIGDGIICSVDRNSDADRALRLLSQPDSGNYSGETEFLTSENMTKRETLMGKTKIMRGKSSAVMIMTDGVADDYFPNTPELLRLFLDLELNSIVRVSETDEGEVPENIPEPLCHPWVNNNEKIISVQYAKRISEITGESLETLWKNRSLIKKAALENFEDALPENDSEKLKRWLDSYTERGSFDDRTLVVCEMW